MSRIALYLGGSIPSSRSLNDVPEIFGSSNDGFCVDHANGLNSSGATIPPYLVAEAYLLSQNNRGGSSG